MTQEKRDYQRPQVVRLTTEAAAKGYCGNGTGDSGSCDEYGSSAGGNCYASGASATGSCYDGPSANS